jgi:NAD-dependent dihydropyrimidine dehydrogenase PreA subunit/bacterioferritin-associated ferredoxin
MKMVKFVSMVDPEKCTGDKRCERVCPSGAIEVEEKLAVVDEGRCVACGKCEDVCREGAVRLVPRALPLFIMCDASEVEEEKIRELCRKAHLYPEQFVCACTGTLAREAAAAILKGAGDPEELSAMTAVRSGCGIYCTGAIMRLFAAAGIDIGTGENNKWYNLPLSVFDVPTETAKKRPMYRIEEDKRVLFKEEVFDDL